MNARPLRIAGAWLRSAFGLSAATNFLFLLFALTVAILALLSVFAATALFAFARIVFAFANFLRHTRQISAAERGAQLGNSPDEASQNSRGESFSGKELR